MWENYIRAAEGLIFVVDGANSDLFPNALISFSRIIQWIKPGIPILLLWNKADLSEYMPFSELAEDLVFSVPCDEGVNHFAICEVSAFHNTEIRASFDWLVEKVNENILRKPVEMQALRVYSRNPEVILAQTGKTDIFENFLELYAEILKPALFGLKYFPLSGKNYLIMCYSELCYCMAIFYDTTPLERSPLIVKAALQKVENSIRELGRPFPLLSPEKKSLTIDYLNNYDLQAEPVA